MEDITVSYDNLKSKWGVKLITDEVTAIDIGQGSGTTARTARSPGPPRACRRASISSRNGEPDWMATRSASPRLEGRPSDRGAAQAAGGHARRRGIRNAHPESPYRCPPGPYERACVVANYLRQAKPKSKVLVLDANGEIQSKKALFTQAFESYGH